MDHHLILVDNVKVSYLTEKVENSDKLRPFIIVYYDSLAYVSCLSLRFRCYSSCAGGIHRRPVVLCFSLENG
ncbi:unnamed protein product [Gongylonema pulchrum]|uniref:P53 domain-containing protein n=1 Tax=Gongylonema pulchrum TaxID=637853 RepID=A0A183DP14_9BILA|nr:unnamed protein product [Gongylonema pulchrum]